MYSLIVFDWDGTLIDSESRIVGCMKSAIADMALPEREDHRLSNIIGLGLPEAIQMLFPGLDDSTMQQLIKLYGQYFVTADTTPSPLFPGIEAMLQKLQAMDLHLAVATGKSRKGLARVFNNTKLDKYFIASRCADETQSKPHPQMLCELMEELSVSPQRTLMVGDTAFDMDMAARAGVDSVAVSYGVHELDQLTEHGPRYVADTADELIGWIQAQIQK